MITSDKGIEFIMDMEGVRKKAYLDTGGVWTIGVGHTGPDVYEGQVADDALIRMWLKEDIHDAESAVNRLVNVELTQNQFDALVSFVFNIGETAFRKSTLLRKLNENNFPGAAKEFLRWNKDNGQTISGLTKRRLLESRMFEEE